MDQDRVPDPDRNLLPAFAVGGEMGERTRTFDWTKTPLGPIEGWPQPLQTVVGVMLSSRYAMWLGWGPDFTFFYNDDYARMTLGPKHPWALGRPAREVWPEVWEDIGPRAESVVRTGQATWDEGLLLFLERRGFSEETYHTFSYSPIPDDLGGIGGMLCVVTEDTERTIGERRLRTLRELATRTADEPRSVDDACQTSAEILAGNRRDVPFVLIYLLDSQGRRLSLAGCAGVDRETPISPVAVEWRDEASPWPFSKAAQAGMAIEVEALPDRFGPLPGGAWPEPSTRAVVLPMARQGQAQLAGFVVAGVSPRRPLDDGYRGFLDLLAGQVANAVANARAYEEERDRAEKLAELDRAKTAFFSNVSHEFRTPLTLMLGPVEDILARPDHEFPSGSREILEVVNRNGLRLLRLVNSLLDFSRIEAGRVQASYQPTDLAALTADLASVFRSACERAGLGLVVDCPPLSEPAYVDREMWEKVVLNLLSNAFKFTFEGEIAVSLRQTDGSAELRVRDTGTGIPAGEIPRLFERFHRVENAKGRTHEGSGIGLALVQELVKLHSGAIRVESVLGEGTTFLVSLPMGSAHLPADRIGSGRYPSTTGQMALPYAEEALRWLPDEVGGEDADSSGPRTEPEPIEPNPRPGPDRPVDEKPRILLADDNADMRQYVLRLLAGSYRVEAVPDGEAALLAARDRPPDLILSDVMMPRLDGFGLLKAVRSDPRTSGLPVILLSARAGEESRVEGLAAGADDYLVKPFSARELFARVSAHLQMARLRREAGESLRRSEERLRIALTAARMVAWRWNPEDGSLQVSDNATEVFGLPEGSTLLGIDQGVALLHPDDVDGYRETFTKAIREQGSYLTHYRLIRPDDGRVLWMEERGHAVRDEPDAAAWLTGVVMDITETRRAEEEVRASESRLRQLADAMPQLVWVTRPDRSVEYVNQRWLDYTGQAQGECLTPADWAAAIHPDDLDRVDEASVLSHATGQPFEAEYRIRNAAGVYRWHLGRAVPSFDEKGRLVRRFGAATDIDDRRRAEDDARFLAEASATLATLVDEAGTLEKVARLAVPSFADWCSVDMVGEGDLPRRVAVAHVDPAKVDQAHDLHRRFPPDPATPRGLAHVIRSGESQWVAEITDEMLIAGTRDADHLALIRGLGLRSYLCVPLKGRDGALGAITFVAAESGRRYRQEDLRLAEDLASRAAIAIENARLYGELKQADRSKDEFLATLAHELRNPLAPIRNVLHLMSQTSADEDGFRDERAMAERQVVHLTRLIDDLMDVARISQGKIELQKEVVELAKVVNQAIETARPKIDERRHRLIVSLPATPVRLEADPTRLEQVLWNLLNNAAKYTEPGGEISLTVEREGKEVAIRVRDTGIGIRPEMLPKVFQMFAQLEDHRGYSQGGLGIGLSLVLTLVKLHGGSISARSDGPGTGSEFLVRLPILAGAGAGSAPKPDGRGGRGETPARRRILIVDDNVDAARSLARLLSRLYDQEVRLVHDGPEALEVAEVFRPEVILLDIGLPGMDGNEVARSLRERPEFDATLIVALTGWGQDADRLRSREAGIDHHLVKPVDPAQLQKILAETRMAAT